MSKLDDLRNEINIIDKKMAELFEQRMDIVKNVAEYKINNSIPVVDSNRENEVINNNLDCIKNTELKNYYVNFIKNNINISKQYQNSLLKGDNIAYSGIVGSYAYIASKKMFPNQNYIAYSSFNKAYQSVVDGINNKVVLPIENSYAGNVGEVLDLIFFGSLYINQILDFSIEHCLLTNGDKNINNIKKIVSHPQAIMQCSEFIEKHNFEVIEEVNTAVAAKKLKDDTLMSEDTAVIASIDAAHEYGLSILREKINDNVDNTTRFASFSNVLYHFEKSDKVHKNFIIVFTVKNESGALAKCLDVIGSYNFNMRNLCSRPVKSLMWNYYFYCDIEGDIDSDDFKDMFKALQVFCDKLKVVGVYLK